MIIACLAWGSLVWDPQDLPIEDTWCTDGPQLQVDYLRKSNDGRLTLVLTPTASMVYSLWAKMSCDTISQATEALRKREKIPKSKKNNFIGQWSTGQLSPACIENLSDWAKSKNIEHIVWTSLPPKFDDATTVATPSQVIAYLASLTGEARIKAEEYVRRTPSQIATTYRQIIEEQLHWTSLS
jgi:hypothetical protein